MADEERLNRMLDEGLPEPDELGNIDIGAHEQDEEDAAEQEQQAQPLTAATKRLIHARSLQQSQFDAKGVQFMTWVDGLSEREGQYYLQWMDARDAGKFGTTLTHGVFEWFAKYFEKEKLATDMKDDELLTGSLSQVFGRVCTQLGWLSLPLLFSAHLANNRVFPFMQATDELASPTTAVSPATQRDQDGGEDPSMQYEEQRLTVPNLRHGIGHARRNPIE